MWWPDRGAARRLLLNVAGVGIAGGLLAGCFQPLYGNSSFTSTPGIGEALSKVDVAQIATRGREDTPDARVAVELRNQLVFDLAGGQTPPPPTHRLVVNMTTTRLQVIIDTETGRPDVEDYGINATYTLTEIKTGKPVVSSQTFARVSYDIPGQQQRFARARGLRDSEDRAAKVIADNIRARLASYFVAGT
jgi:LPS-assembly lipoprotein